ncbi:response regulator [Vibrio sp. SCSIO 43137]|uniref:response regulator n=1 Tax=Vibrio sp. SCSIO 43137 TaxID=3021011 RepID=UPI002306F0BF|nr:response regulator [Vibrio sp. SCSIO 43137]WCE31038.1 response regulator [Vibrio sp. SCSIO 43137]
MEQLRKVYQYAEPNLTLIGWLGFVGFPAYYFVWQYIFPQPYENVWLRLICSLLFLGIVVRNKLNVRLRSYMHLYYQLVIIAGLPFFFFYMLLMNGWSQIWVMSFMSSIFLHILLVHITWIMCLQTIIALVLATFFAWVAKGYSLEMVVDWSQLPVFLFTYLFGSLCFYRYNVDYDSKVALAKSFGAGIAHEMRNPLSSLSRFIDVIQSSLPNTRIDRKDHYQLSRSQITRLQQASDDAWKVIRSGNETIDLLLTSIDENRVSRSSFKLYSAQDIVENAIESFSYKSSEERNAVSLNIKGDFEFFGSDTLLKYVVYNLLKNAFHHGFKEAFSIDVTLRAGVRNNKVIVRDNGTGIAPELINDIFRDFYTTGQSGSHGLGLPFCKKVMASFGGKIKCSSEPGKWTKFTLTLPLSKSDSVAEIKNELAKQKSVLMISKGELLVNQIRGAADIIGFELTTVTAESALSSSQANYDVVLIDLDPLRRSANLLDKLEAMYAYGEGQLVYLYCGEIIKRPVKAGVSPLWIKKEQWQQSPVQQMDKLLFDSEQVIVPVSVAIPKTDFKRTVMIVDDNESLRRFTAILLEKQGIEVIQKENGLQAIDTLEKEDVDLILMDIEMPLMDGIEASSRIRRSDKNYAGIPIIAHTGDNSVAMMDKIDSSDMSDYILKPADKEKLLDKIADWI